MHVWVLTNAVGASQLSHITCHVIQLGLHVRREIIVHILRKMLLEEGRQHSAPAGGSKCPALLHYIAPLLNHDYTSQSDLKVCRDHTIKRNPVRLGFLVSMCLGTLRHVSL